jgi:hypothetical protein
MERYTYRCCRSWVKRIPLLYDDDPRDVDGRYIFDRDTVDKHFSGLNVGSRTIYQEGPLNFGLK